MVWLKKVVLIGIGVVGLSALFLVLNASHIPQVHAAPTCTGTDFVCPGGYGGNGGDGNWDEGVQLDRTDGGPGGSNDPSTITSATAAGTTLSFKAHYHINEDVSGENAYLWVIINTDTGTSGVNIVSEDSPSAGGFSPLVDNVCGPYGSFPNFCPPTNTDPNTSECPSFYYAIGNYYEASGGSEDGYAGHSYNAATDPDFGNEVNCHGSGQSIIWPFEDDGADIGGPTVGTQNENFTINIPNTYHADMTVSVRAYLSIGGDITDVYSRSAPQYFKVQKTSFDGYVYSDHTQATGRPLAGVVMNISDCGSTVYDQATTDGSGHYAFPDDAATVGQGICIAPASGTFTAGDNSQYNGYSPGSGYSTSCGTADGSCGGYDFTFEPVPQTPSITKASSAGGGSLHPGDTDSFTISITNSYDADVPDVNLYDYIPVNLDPGTVSQGSLTLSTVGGAPPDWGWAFCGPHWCTNPISWPAGSSGAPLGVGGDAFGYTNVFSVSNYCNDCDGNRPTAGWNLSDLPAYGTLTFSFSAKVKDKNDILPAADPGTYCAASPEPSLGTYDGNFTYIAQNCPDPNIGNDLQGVRNRGYVSMNNGTPNTADTYDPIPGSNCPSCSSNPPATICLGKTYGSFDSHGGTDSGVEGGLETFVNDCGVQVLDNTDNFPATGLPNVAHYIYSDPVSNFMGGSAIVDSGTFTTQAEVTVPGSSKAGPTWYAIDDQPGADNGGNLDPAMVENSCTWCTPSSLAYPQHLSTAPMGSLGMTLYNSEDYANGWGPNGTFTSDWSNYNAHPIGSNATNQAVLTVVDLSTPGHPTTAYPSNTVAIKHINVIRPGVQVTNGNVAAGAGIVANDQPCLANPNIAGGGDPTLGEINTNPSEGQYVVSASGNNVTYSSGSIAINGFSSNNSLNTLSQNNAGIVCLPDVQQSVMNFGSSMAAVGNTLNTNDDTSHGYAGKVVKHSGNFTIGSGGPVTINQRFTLFVQGNVDITNNVSFGPNGSMAVVATGDIRIHHNVTRLDGFYYTRGNNGGTGTINTCEDAPGVTLGQDPGDLTQAQCGQQLVVNGFLLGQELRLNRSPIAGTGEQINFSPQLYLNTPPGLSNLGLNVLGSYSLQLPRY